MGITRYTTLARYTVPRPLVPRNPSVYLSQAKLGFNHGWLVQAEAPPWALFGSFKTLLESEDVPAHDVAFYFVHWLTDLAGAEPSGDGPMCGSLKFTTKLHRLRQRTQLTPSHTPYLHLPGVARSSLPPSSRTRCSPPSSAPSPSCSGLPSSLARHSTKPSYAAQGSNPTD